MNNNTCLLFFALLLAGVGAQMHARHDVMVPRNDRSFYDMVTKYQFAAVLFYEDSKDIRRDPQARQQVDFMSGTFESLGRNGYYRDGSLAFIKVNVLRDDLATVQHAYQIDTLPCVMLFKSGVPAQNTLGQRLFLTGMVSADQVAQLIQANFKAELDANVQRVTEERRRQRELDALYGPRWYGGFGWGWPGYGWGWGPGYYGGWGWGGWRGGWGGGCSRRCR